MNWISVLIVVSCVSCIVSMYVAMRAWRAAAKDWRIAAELWKKNYEDCSKTCDSLIATATKFVTVNMETFSLLRNAQIELHEERANRRKTQ